MGMSAPGWATGGLQDVLPGMSIGKRIHATNLNKLHN